MDFSMEEIENHLNKSYSVEWGDLEFAENECLIKPHWHEKYEFIFVNKGSVKFIIDNQEYFAPENSIISVSPNMLHTGWAGSTGCNIFNVTFNHKYLLDDSVYEQSLKNSFINHTIEIEPIITDPTAVSYFKNIWNNRNNDIISKPILEKGLICIFFSYLVENFSTNHILNKSKSAKFNSILEYINQNYTNQITTEQIAEHFSYNKSYFCRKFQENTKITPTEYILRLRINHSQKLMTTSSLSLNSIAAQSGFATYPYFSAKFKQLVGISPVEWRNKFINNQKS